MRDCTVVAALFCSLTCAREEDSRGKARAEKGWRERHKCPIGSHRKHIRAGPFLKRHTRHAACEL
eukprot:5604241-Pleurochrysis_carterae.AAC.1